MRVIAVQRSISTQQRLFRQLEVQFQSIRNYHSANAFTVNITVGNRERFANIHQTTIFDFILGLIRNGEKILFTEEMYKTLLHLAILHENIWACSQILGATDNKWVLKRALLAYDSEKEKTLLYSLLELSLNERNIELHNKIIEIIKGDRALLDSLFDSILTQRDRWFYEKFLEATKHDGELYGIMLNRWVCSYTNQDFAKELVTMTLDSARKNRFLGGVLIASGIKEELAQELCSVQRDNNTIIEVLKQNQMAQGKGLIIGLGSGVVTFLPFIISSFIMYSEVNVDLIIAGLFIALTVMFIVGAIACEIGKPGTEILEINVDYKDYHQAI